MEDLSDEETALKCFNKTEFQCHNGRCLPRERVRNGMVDCKDGEDEEYHLICDLDTEFKCNLSGRCLPRK